MAGTSGGSTPRPWASTLPGRLGAGAPSAQSIRGIAAVNRSDLIRMWSRWSAPGPHGIRNRWSSVGTSGHGRHATIPGHSTYTPRTREAGASRRRVRIPPPLLTFAIAALTRHSRNVKSRRTQTSRWPTSPTAMGKARIRVRDRSCWRPRYRIPPSPCCIVQRKATGSLSLAPHYLLSAGCTSRSQGRVSVSVASQVSWQSKFSAEMSITDCSHEWDPISLSRLVQECTKLWGVAETGSNSLAPRHPGLPLVLWNAGVLREGPQCQVDRLRGKLEQAWNIVPYVVIEV
jgi:hypothetical protein